jgi:hypothetical protein
MLHAGLDLLLGNLVDWIGKMEIWTNQINAGWVKGGAKQAGLEAGVLTVCSQKKKGR